MLIVKRDNGSSNNITNHINSSQLYPLFLITEDNDVEVNETNVNVSIINVERETKTSSNQGNERLECSYVYVDSSSSVTKWLFYFSFVKY